MPEEVLISTDGSNTMMMVGDEVLAVLAGVADPSQVNVSMM
jgi:hypothetical protein